MLIFTWAQGIDPPKPILATALSPFYTQRFLNLCMDHKGNTMHSTKAHICKICWPHIHTFAKSTHLLTTYFPWPRTMSWKVFSFFRQLTWWGESGLEDLVTLLMAYEQRTKAVVESVGHPRWVDAISWACISGVESKAQPESAEPDSAMAWWK